jgi:hypothetical protein
MVIVLKVFLKLPKDAPRWEGRDTVRQPLKQEDQVVQSVYLIEQRTVGRKRARERETSGIAQVGSGQTREGARKVNTCTIYQENV